MSESQSLRVLVYKEEDAYIAQALERDISVQAPDIARLQVRFEAAVMLEADVIDELPEAPARFHELWNEGLGLESKLDNTEMRLAA